MINFFDPASDKSSDLGTPARDSDVQVSLSIDGRAISVPAGTSVMRAAAMLGTSIPKLCATDSLEAFGSCRMCMVEIEGMRGYPASCTTPVSEGMVVRTETPRLAGLRRNVMELYISDHPLDCLTCSATVCSAQLPLADQVRQSSGWSVIYSSITLRRKPARRGVSVCTTMPSLTGVVQEAG